MFQHNRKDRSGAQATPCYETLGRPNALHIAVVTTAIAPLLLAATPREYLGRVMAVFGPLQQLASMLSVLVAGLLASTMLRNFSVSVGGLHLGPIDTIFTVSGLVIVIGGGYGIFALPGRRTAAPAVTPEPGGVTP